MSTFTSDIVTMLQNNGFGTIGVDIFVSQDQPPTPDNILSVTNTGTMQADLPTIGLSWPTVQIIARGTRGGGQECEERIYKVRDFMKSVGNYAVNDSIFVYINHLSGPVDIGIDITMRPMYSLNLVCLRTKY